MIPIRSLLFVALVVAAQQLPAQEPPRFTSISIGAHRTCGLAEDGVAHCWGNVMRGPATGEDLGWTVRDVPTRVAGDLPLARLADGSAITCGLDADGRAYCWGLIPRGGTTVYEDVPDPVEGDFRFEQIAAGANFACGLTEEGTVYCWGHGLGDRSLRARNVGDLPTAIDSDVPFTQLYAGSHHACGLTADARAYCWGENLFGQLGDGSMAQAPGPRPVAGELRFSRLALGQGDHACGLTLDGKAYCWGRNGHGQLGDGTTTTPAAPDLGPRAVRTDLSFVDIAVGTQHTCALGITGEAYCWGGNSEGTLGDGTRIDRTVPRRVTQHPAFVQIAAGMAHTCGRTAENAVYCWGFNGYGQLGDASSVSRRTPVQLRQR